jgi:membrane protease YdiL (CAAX protease family)
VALVVASALVGGLVYPMLDGLSSVTGARVVWWPWTNLLVAALANAIVLRWLDKRPWRYLALGRAAARPSLMGGGALLGVLAIGLPCAALLGAGLLRVRPAPDGSWLAAAGSIAAFLAPAALFEELLVRGYPFQVLRESVGAAGALALTSIVFGVLHAQNPEATGASLAVVTLAGIFLGVIVLATGSLWAAFAAHFAWNWTLGAVLHAPISGLATLAMPDYRVVDAGPDWLTGGAWGPEGGVGAAAGMLAALLLLIRRARGRRGAAWTEDLFARPAGRGG